MEKQISYLIKRISKYRSHTDEENLLRVYSEEDLWKAMSKLNEYYNKYSGYEIVVEQEGTEKLEYENLEELLNEDWS